MEWYELKDPINKCVAYGNLDENNRMINTQARVWLLDDGNWAHACRSEACKNELEDFEETSAGKQFVGTEPSRPLAIKAVMDNLKEDFL